MFGVLAQPSLQYSHWKCSRSSCYGSHRGIHCCCDIYRAGLLGNQVGSERSGTDCRKGMEEQKEPGRKTAQETLHGRTGTAADLGVSICGSSTVTLNVSGEAS